MNYKTSYLQQVTCSAPPSITPTWQLQIIATCCNNYYYYYHYYIITTPTNLLHTLNLTITLFPFKLINHANKHEVNTSKKILVRSQVATNNQIINIETLIATVKIYNSIDNIDTRTTPMLTVTSFIIIIIITNVVIK